MSNVVDIDTMRPHRTGPLDCDHCGYRWVGVWLADMTILNCPECNAVIMVEVNDE